MMERVRGSRLRWAGACALALVFGVGCARYQNVNVTSEPAGADVFLDGKRVGRTPIRLTIDRDRDHLVFLKLEGHVPERQVLSLNRAPDGIDFLTPADVELALGRAPGQPGDQSRELEVQIENEAPSP